jgi:DeoR/GlpR family transcriptional regulator of sugar metabolism
MLKEERQNEILEMLRRSGKVLAIDLSLHFEVSEDTVRRDLNDLAEAHLIQRVHGGALLRSPGLASFKEREKQPSQAKIEIAKAAARMTRNGQVILLDGGTTTLQVAQNLSPELQATIITNSAPIAVALCEYAQIHIVLLGGNFLRNSMVAVGVETVESLHHFRADLCMLGVCSLHPSAGLCVDSLEETYVKRAMIASSAEVVALASAEKLNTAAPFIIGPLSDLTHLITEKSVPTEQLAPYRDLGISVIQV